MDSVLRPRDIQARIRAGETPEDVAAAAQTTVDRIMGFATPVLAERAYQAQLAQRASVRRRAAAGQVGNLGSAVTAHLEALEVDPESVEWDAWRREDGRWTVVAGYVARGEHHQAAFAYDAAGRFVVAEDDEARTLVGERRTPAPEEPPAVDEPPVGAALDDLLIGRDQPGGQSVEQPVGQRRERAGEQLPLGDDAISLVTGRAPRAPLEDEVTFDLTEASTAVRAAGPPSTADADWISTQASERPEEPAAPVPAAPSPQEVPEETEVEGDAREEEKEEAMTLFEVPAPQADTHADTQPDVQPDVQPQAQPEITETAETAAAEAEEPAPRPARASRSRGRASVPSWDEIMFGTPKSE